MIERRRESTGMERKRRGREAEEELHSEGTREGQITTRRGGGRDTVGDGGAKCVDEKGKKKGKGKGKLSRKWNLKRQFEVGLIIVEFSGLIFSNKLIIYGEVREYRIL